MDQYFTLEEVKLKQKACPMSIGQAEAGRFTYCVGEQCMAWQWLVNDLFFDLMAVGDELPEGYEVASEKFEQDGKEVVKIIKKPTHGRCGMVPVHVS